MANYYEDNVLWAFIGDLILSKTDTLYYILSKDMSEMPLLLNHESFYARILVRWRLNCGK